MLGPTGGAQFDTAYPECEIELNIGNLSSLALLAPTATLSPTQRKTLFIIISEAARFEFMRMMIEKVINNTNTYTIGANDSYMVILTTWMHCMNTLGIVNQMLTNADLVGYANRAESSETYREALVSVGIATFNSALPVGNQYAVNPDFV